MATELKVGPEDRIHIIISGTKGQGAGRAARQVDYEGNLSQFLTAYGEGEQAVEEPNWKSLQNLGKANAAELQKKMAEMTAKLLGGSGKALPQRIVDATCAFLVKEHKFVISDKDPGVDQFYISSGDLVPQMVNVPGDGVAWHIMAAAPFGFVLS